MARGGLAVLCLCASAACSTLYRDHGYVPSDRDLAEIAVGRDNRATVAEKIGTPGTMGVLEDSGWYYVQSRFAERTYHAPKEVDRQVVAISFTPAGVVQNVERFGIERGEIVVLSRRVTEANTQGIGLLRQLMGSLGKVNAENIFGRPGGT
jgi:outer membrane protein assembly factor BamE (lipoprotein component of BamABCDE complex)